MDQENRNTFIKTSVKYLLEGFVIALCAFYVPIFFKSSLRKPTIKEVISIALTASLTMIILDMFSQRTASGARIGTGFAIGTKII